MSIFGPYMISQLLKKHEVIILFMNEENDNRGEFILSFEENNIELENNIESENINHFVIENL